MSDIHDTTVERLDPRRGERWLDLATGTGAVAIRAARAGADVTAQDLALSKGGSTSARVGLKSESLDLRLSHGVAHRPMSLQRGSPDT
jgi:ubiquinone/menaquinone biosynthesis C-methylase UbiE